MKILKILSIVAITILFSQCGSAKFEENPPFTITSATYNNWTGGQPGNKGITVHITYTSNNTMQFDSIYFSNKTAKLESSKTKDKKMITTNFISSVKPDIILDKNTSEEINNAAPEIKKFPFDLEQNEAIISYIVKGKTKYFKIKSIKKEKSVFYPSVRKQKSIN